MRRHWHPFSPYSELGPVAGARAAGTRPSHGASPSHAGHASLSHGPSPAAAAGGRAAAAARRSTATPVMERTRARQPTEERLKRRPEALAQGWWSRPATSSVAAVAPRAAAASSRPRSPRSPSVAQTSRRTAAAAAGRRVAYPTGPARAAAATADCADCAAAARRGRGTAPQWAAAAREPRGAPPHRRPAEIQRGPACWTTPAVARPSPLCASAAKSPP